MAIWQMPRSPFSGETQEEVGSKGQTLWEAGKEPQVMGAKPGGWTLLPYLLILAHHALIHPSAWKVSSANYFALRDAVLKSSAII
jgi:hypothetical protein